MTIRERSQALYKQKAGKSKSLFQPVTLLKTRTLMICQVPGLSGHKEEEPYIKHIRTQEDVHQKVFSPLYSRLHYPLVFWQTDSRLLTEPGTVI